MKRPQTGKQVKRIFVLYLTTLFMLSGCGPMANSLIQPWLTIASVETSGPAGPLETVELTPAAGVVPLCPQITPPAMLLYLPGDDYALFDPASGATCPLSFAETLPGMVLLVQNDLFVASRTTGPEGAATVIERHRSDGTVELLPYTMTDTQTGTELVAFTVSADARLIAWSLLGPTAGSDLPVTTLLIADLERGEMLHGVAPDVGAAPLALLPIRFSQDGSVLYYALQPYGLGGIWSSYVARYHNLYAVSTSSNGTPELLFDCAELGTGLCLGDFSTYDSTVIGLAYVNRADNTIIIQNNAGDLLNVLTAEEEYVGYPTWGPVGEFVFYTADLSDDPAVTPLPQLGLLHRVTPHTAPAETVARAPGLVLPVHFFSDTQVVVGWVDENESRGLALVGMDGTVQVLAVPVGATVLGAPALSTVFGVSGGGGIVSTPYRQNR